MDKKTSVVLVVPCFNEAGRFSPAAYGDFLKNQPGTGLLFVDDGSTDGTHDVLARFAAAWPARASVLRLERNRGKGEAVRRGLLQALEGPADWVGYWDADLSTPLTALASFTDLLAARPDLDMVFGARVKLVGRSIERNLWRHWAGRIFVTAADALLDLPLYDSQCGAKLFRADGALRAALAKPFRGRWIFDLALLLRLRRERAIRGMPPLEQSLYEYPLDVWRDPGASHVKWVDFLTSFLFLLDLFIFERLFGRPVDKRPK